MPAVEPPPEYRPQPPIRHFHIIMASNIGTSQFSEGYAFPPISQKPLPCPDWQFLPHQQLEDDSQFEELLISLVGGPLRGYWLWKAYEQQPDESMHPVYRLNFLADPTTFPFIAIRTQTQQFLAYPFSPDLRPNQLVLEVLQLACQSKSNENHYYPIKITPRSFLLRPLQTIDSQQDSCAPLMQDLLNLGYVPISFEERKELLGSSSLNLEEKKENPDPSSFIKHLLQARKGSPVYQKTTPDGTVEYRIPIGSRERFYNIMHFWTNNLHPVLARCTKQFYKTPSPSPNETFSGLHFVPGTHGGFIPGVLSEPTDPASTAALSTSSSSSSATNPTPMEISLNSSEDWVVLYSPTTPYSAREDCPPQENEIIRLTTMRTRGNLSSATIEFQRSSQSYQITVPRGEVATVRKVLLKHTESLEEIQRSNVSIFQLHFH
ncbi:MAG: hypothetical protein A3C42_05155 [Chlamydiae bacterium RIFCSPHIGHO2_02_FULL_45_9]|nr:MAG: hypothetical protein A3C42_05155 [Chlamydiae bacterium RIFCSPHIGHO2_02_FULL_45_9]